MVYCKKKIVRSLLNVETLMANNHASCQGTSQFVTLLHIRCKINIDDLFKAYTDLCSDDPVLSSVLYCVKGEWILKQHSVDYIPLFKSEISLKKLEASDSLLETELNTILDSKQHIIRMRVISNPQYDEHIWLLTLHHGIADAYTAKYFLSKLLQKVISPSNKNTVSSTQKTFFSTKVEELPVIERDYPNLQVALSELAPQSAPIFTNVHTLIFPEKIISILAKFAEYHNYSLNSLLTSISTIAIKKLLGISWIETFSAISCRGCNFLQNETGCFIDIFSLKLKQDNFDMQANYFNQALFKYRQSSDTLQALDKTIASDIPITLSRDYAINFCAGIGFTNNGNIDKIIQSTGVEILSYRSVANRNSGDLLTVFHFSFLKKHLVISLAIPSILLKKQDQIRLINLLRYYIYHIE